MTKPTFRVSQNVAPIYRDASYSSGQITQAIWGAGISVLETKGQFSKVVGEDLYEGWIPSAFLDPCSDDSDNAISTIASLFAEVYKEPVLGAEIITRLTTGCRIVMGRKAAVGRFVPIELTHGVTGYIHEAQVSFTYLPSPTSDEAFGRLKGSERAVNLLHHILNRVVDSAKLFVGVPYLWGGTTPFGLDCSGFTQISYRLSGIQLLRDSSMQWRDRRFVTIDGGSDLATFPLEGADLLFFNSKQESPGSVTHVGIALGDGRFIHAAGKGRGVIISSCDDVEFGGIFIGARRLINLDHLTIESA